MSFEAVPWHHYRSLHSVWLAILSVFGIVADIVLFVQAYDALILE